MKNTPDAQVIEGAEGLGKLIDGDQGDGDKECRSRRFTEAGGRVEGREGFSPAGEIAPWVDE